MAHLSETQIMGRLLSNPEILDFLYKQMLVAILTWEKLTFEERQNVRDLVREDIKLV